VANNDDGWRDPMQEMIDQYAEKAEKFRNYERKQSRKEI